MRQCEKGNKQFDLEQIDSREALEIAGISYEESGKNIGRNYIGLEECPFCLKGNNHLGVRVDAPVFSCFSCGKKGNLLKLFAKIIGFNEAIETLAEATPIELRSKIKESRERSVKVELPKYALPKISSYHSDYLEKRGFNAQKLTDEYNLHFTGPIGDYSNCIIVPVIRNNKLITFTTISIEKQAGIRYVHLPEEKSIISVKETLFGIESTDGSCIVVEGIFDKFRIGSGCVCSFGTHLGIEQITLLRKFERVVTLMDGDKAGIEATEKLINELGGFVPSIIPVYLDEGIDPDKMIKSDIKKIKRLIGK